MGEARRGIPLRPADAYFLNYFHSRIGLSVWFPFKWMLMFVFRYGRDSDCFSLWWVFALVAFMGDSLFVFFYESVASPGPQGEGAFIF